MYVWDASGNLMFDALGLTENGIQRDIIRNDMVSEDANISAEKLDIESLFNVINEDGSHTLKSSKIYVDADNQTLDLSFKTMTTNISNASSIANNAYGNSQSALSTAGAANSTASSANYMANEANNIAKTADTNASTAVDVANTANSTANAANTNATNALNKANTNETNILALTETVTTQGTDISVMQGQISSKIWQQDITTAVDAVEIGGRNLASINDSIEGKRIALSSYYPGASDTAHRITKLIPARVGEQFTISTLAEGVITIGFFNSVNYCISRPDGYVVRESGWYGTYTAPDNTAFIAILG